MASILLGNIKTKSKRLGLGTWPATILGCLIISAWTLIRFFNQAPNFDQVGQQVLAHQWLHGFHDGSVIGPTNYVLKMFFVYMPLDWVPLPGQLKLVFMTLLINILTFLLLIYVLKRLWGEFYPKSKTSFSAPLTYLALISGSVFWVSFTNSRNLEVAGGVFLIYLCIRTQAKPSLRNYALLILLGSILFFADPLQMYMTLLPALIFIRLKHVSNRNRQQLVIFLRIVACAVISILMARLLTRLIQVAWNTSFINTGQSISFSLSSLKLSIEQMARLYAGGYEGGRLREAVDLLVTGSVVIGAAYYAWRKPKTRGPLALAGIVWLVDLAVFIISGQAEQGGTSRYLIMTVPAFILALCVVLYNLSRSKTRTYIIASVLLFNILTLAIGFARAWNPHFSNNNHDRSAIAYFKDHQYSYGYASIGTALSSDYLSNWRVNLLPLGCDPDYVLKKTTLFFDKASFRVAQQTPEDSLIPIVLDSDNIKINQAACGTDQIQQKLGPSQKVNHLSDGSSVLLYKASQLQYLR